MSRPPPRSAPTLGRSELAPEVESLHGGLVNGRYRMAGEASRWAVGDAHPAVDLVDHDVVTLVYAGVDARHYLELQRRLTAEVERTRPLRGSALVSLRDCGALANGRPYFVLARVQTPPLARYLQERGALGPLPALALAQRLLETAQLAHAQGVFLGDIRPSNVFVQEQLGADGTRVLSPQLVDIGFARGVFDGLVKLPEVPAVYRSPEVRAGTPLAAADDTYAIGSVLHFMLTGRAPRENGDTAEGLPPILDKIVSRALSAKRSQRWPTAGAFLEAIEAARHVLSMPAGVQQVLRQFMDAHPGLKPESTSNADLPTVQFAAGAATTRIGGTVPFDPRALAAALIGARVAQPITEGEPEADEPLTPDALRRILRVVSAAEGAGQSTGADTVPAVAVPDRARAHFGLVEPGAGPAPSDPMSRTPTGLELKVAPNAPRPDDNGAQVTVTRTRPAPTRGTTGPLTNQASSAAAPVADAPLPRTPTGALPRTPTGAVPRTPTGPSSRAPSPSGKTALVASPPTGGVPEAPNAQPGVWRGPDGFVPLSGDAPAAVQGPVASPAPVTPARHLPRTPSASQSVAAPWRTLGTNEELPFDVKPLDVDSGELRALGDSPALDPPDTGKRRRARRWSTLALLAAVAVGGGAATSVVLTASKDPVAPALASDQAAEYLPSAAPAEDAPAPAPAPEQAAEPASLAPAIVALTVSAAAPSLAPTAEVTKGSDETADEVVANLVSVPAGARVVRTRTGEVLCLATPCSIRHARLSGKSLLVHFESPGLAVQSLYVPLDQSGTYDITLPAQPAGRPVAETPSQATASEPGTPTSPSPPTSPRSAPPLVSPF